MAVLRISGVSYLYKYNLLMAKAKKREKTYLQKVAIKGSFEDVISLSVIPDKKDDKPKPVSKKKEKK
jgi:hypothetical protein